MVDQFVELACLNYSNDDKNRHLQANAMLASDPSLSQANLWSASTVGDVASVESFLNEDPSLLDTKGGPNNWEPLLYACYSRVQSANPGHSTLKVAELLLERGANANAIYWWDGKYPFTALTGAMGEGEHGPVHQPRHPQWQALAELLLDHGAAPDDSQALYNRMFSEDDECLELLLSRGLNRDHYPADKCTGGTPAPSILGFQLCTAASRGRLQRVELLLAHHARMDEKAYGRTPWESAIQNGHSLIAKRLQEAGATTRSLSKLEQFATTCLSGDSVAARQFVEVDSSLIKNLPADLLRRAVEASNMAGVRLLLDLGFPVNSIDSSTALHSAAWNGNLEMIRTLLAAGADRNIKDTAHSATPADWARYSGNLEAAEEIDSFQI